jgi:leucyl-tRNA synthetase
VIKKVSEDIPVYKFNTAIAALMEFSNDWKSVVDTGGKKERAVFSHQDLVKLIKLIAPLAPFMAEELWQMALEMNIAKADDKISVHQQSWPEYSEAVAQAKTVIIPVQVNGKVRGEMKIENSKLDKMNKDDIVGLAQDLDTVKSWLVDDKNEKRPIHKAIYVEGKILNLVL